MFSLIVNRTNRDAPNQPQKINEFDITEYLVKFITYYIWTAFFERVERRWEGEGGGMDMEIVPENETLLFTFRRTFSSCVYIAKCTYGLNGPACVCVSLPFSLFSEFRGRAEMKGKGKNASYLYCLQWCAFSGDTKPMHKLRTKISNLMHIHLRNIRIRCSNWTTCRWNHSFTEWLQLNP